MNSFLMAVIYTVAAMIGLALAYFAYAALEYWWQNRKLRRMQHDLIVARRL